MNDILLFDSLTSPIPGIRRDIRVIPIQDQGRELLYFHDPMGYASPNFALDRQVETVLSLINGQTSVKQISELSNGNVSADELLEFIQLLDQNRILHTKHFKLFSNKIEKQFENSEIRKPALQGESYPSDPEELTHFLNELFENATNGSGQTPKALYAPHIDLRVGSKQYIEAFSILKNIKPKRVVILATSHYSGYFPDTYQDTPFIGTLKDFKLPHRTLKNDQSFIRDLQDGETNNGFTLHDRAHRIEHSIEIHLLFSSFLWDHSFEIAPVLIGSLDELLYHREGDAAAKVELFTQKLKQLDDDDTFYLISGDLSHIGKKFGDQTPAELMKDDIKTIDQRFLQSSVNNNSQKMLSDISSHYDSSRICGFPPLYTFLKTFPELTGQSLNYNWWDEQETESAVSFGSILYV